MSLCLDWQGLKQFAYLMCVGSIIVYPPHDGVKERVIHCHSFIICPFRSMKWKRQ